MFDTRQTTLVVLGVACVIAALAAMALTRATPLAAFREGSRLLDALSWAALLPMLLATLGAVFAATGVGDAVAQIVSAAIPTQSRDACVLAYGLGMALFTIIMGNAFAAFPVMTGRHRPAAADRPASCARRRGRRARHAVRLLRYAADADGGELQHRAGRAARTARSERA